MAPFVKGFGCRPGASDWPGIGGRRRKASEERTRGNAVREGFRMPARRERLARYRGPASESLRRTNAWECGERLAVYGDLAGQRLWRGVIFRRSLRAESR